MAPREVKMYDLRFFKRTDFTADAVSLDPASATIGHTMEKVEENGAQWRRACEKK